MAKGSFRYQPRSQEQVRERANMRSGNFDDYILPKYKKFKPKDGKNIIRILPPTWERAAHFGYDIFIHYSVGPDNSAYLSLADMGKGPDPVSEAHREATRSGDEALARELRASRRSLIWLIDRSQEEEGPQLWAAPFTFDKAIVNLSLDEDTGGVVEIDHPENGCDLRFFKEGQGLKTNYDASKMRLMKPSPISQDDRRQNAWLEFIQENPLPGCLQFYSYDYIAAIFNGKGPVKEVDDDGDDDEQAPPRKAQKPAGVPARGKADEDEEDTPWGDDDEDEKPVTRAKSAGNHKPPARPVNDSDDDGEDSEDEDTVATAKAVPAARRARARPPVDDDEDDVPQAESIRDRIKRKRQEMLDKSEDE